MSTLKSIPPIPFHGSWGQKSAEETADIKLTRHPFAPWSNFCYSEGTDKMIGLEGQMAEEPELRKITQEELDAILVEHEKWLDSGGKEGAKANLFNADLSAKALPNAFKTHNRLRRANLYVAHLKGALSLERTWRGRFSLVRILRRRG